MSNESPSHLSQVKTVIVEQAGLLAQIIAPPRLPGLSQ